MWPGKLVRALLRPSLSPSLPPSCSSPSHRRRPRTFGDRAVRALEDAFGGHDRVVRERERWFQIVMGERYQVDEASTDQRAERLPLPPKLAAELAMKLDLGGGDEPGRD